MSCYLLLLNFANCKSPTVSKKNPIHHNNVPNLSKFVKTEKRSCKTAEVVFSYSRRLNRAAGACK